MKENFCMHWSALTLGAFLLLLVLVLGFFMPLQTDEIAWSYANQRGIIDHFSVMTLLPQCQAADSFAKPLPLSWYPHAFINHLVFMQVDQLIWIRLVGMARFALFLAATWFIVKPLALARHIPPSSLFLLFISILCIDALPLVLQVNRPEQTLLLSCSIFLALALNVNAIVRHTLFKWASSALLILTVLLLFPSHPKAIALLPVALASTYIFFNGLFKIRWITYLVMAMIAGFAFQCAFFWLERYGCSESIVTKNILSNSSLPWDMALSSPMLFLFAAVEAFIKALTHDFQFYYINLRRIEGWLPLSINPISPWMVKIVIFFNITEFLFNVGILLYCIYFLGKEILLLSARRLFIFSKSPIQKPSDTLPIVSYHPPLKLLACACIISFIGVTTITGYQRTFYLSSLEIPLLYLSGLFCIFCAIPHIQYRQIKKWGIVLLSIGFLNIVILICRYYPYATEPETRELFYGNRAILLSPFAYESQKRNIETAYQACGLPPIANAQHLVLDDYTYPILRNSYEPFSFHYITNLFVWVSFDVKELFKNMKRYDSDGIIMDCRQVPQTLMPYMDIHYGYCCMSGKIVP